MTGPGEEREADTSVVAARHLAQEIGVGDGTGKTGVLKPFVMAGNGIRRVNGGDDIEVGGQIALIGGGRHVQPAGQHERSDCPAQHRLAMYDQCFVAVS